MKPKISQAQFRVLLQRVMDREQQPGDPLQMEQMGAQGPPSMGMEALMGGGQNGQGGGPQMGMPQGGMPPMPQAGPMPMGMPQGMPQGMPPGGPPTGPAGMQGPPPELLAQLDALMARQGEGGPLPEGVEMLPGYGAADDADMEALEAFLSGE